MNNSENKSNQMQHITDRYQRIAAAKVFIDENYSQKINLEKIAEQAHLSRFHFHRLFTGIYKITPLKYITRVRLEAAKVLLSKEGMRITEVCDRIGFESHGSFSSLFLKQHGHSPQYYRNRAVEKKKMERVQPIKFVPNCFFEQFKLGESL
jgi:AraC-like DNA-binding protein